jgi:hypothetical protein
MLLVKTLYEKDFNLWLEETAYLLKAGKLDCLDIENLIEEIESMSRREKDRLESNLIRVMQHLLKWQYQPEKRTPSWSYSILEHSRRINKALVNSPSLKNYLTTIFDNCYQEARKAASLETQLSINTFPSDNFFTEENILIVNSDDYLIEKN